MPLSFDTILEGAGIDPASVHLVRHQDQRARGGRTPYALWRNDPEAFALYQSIQRRRPFKVGNLIASFVVPPRDETLFTGLYRVNGIGLAPQGLIDPVGGHDVGGFNLYDTALDERLKEYVGRLVIEWGLGYRSWVQRGARKLKPVIELRRDLGEQPFPGYIQFISNLSEISNLYPEWIDRLREAKGIYLLMCLDSGEQYVGSATGVGGFYERWLQHAAVGGDAIGFKGRKTSGYQVSILEVAGSTATDNEIIAREHLWMRKLRSVVVGLNSNPALSVKVDTLLSSAVA